MQRVPSALFAVMIVSFVLPWYTVSCLGEPVLTSNGIQTLTGQVRINDDFAKDLKDSERIGDATHSSESVVVQILAAVALLCAVGGYGVSIMAPTSSRRRTAMILALVVSILAGVGILFGPSMFASRLDTVLASADGSGGGLLTGIAAGLIKDRTNIAIEIGPWLLLLASLGIVAVSFLADRGLLGEDAGAAVRGGQS